MRFIIRVGTWALAAVGIKALYDRYAPKAKELRRPASAVLDTAKHSSRDVVEHAKAAGSEILADARQRSAEVRDVAADAVDEVPSTPTTGTGVAHEGGEPLATSSARQHFGVQHGEVRVGLVRPVAPRRTDRWRARPGR